MSSDQIDPADTGPFEDIGPSESEIIRQLQDLWSDQANSSSFSNTSVPLIKDDGIDRFQVIQTLGQGGMGCVYLAHDPQLDRQVAIKVPLLDPASDKTVFERFLREGRTAGAINHPNVVTIHEVGDAHQGCYIVCQYINGPTLGEYLQQRGAPLAPAVAARLMLAIAQGVQAAHRKGIIHRDLKPANILLERPSEDASSSEISSGTITMDQERFRPKVSDFGLAGFLDQRTAITLSGSLLGTPNYMAPEQLDGIRLGPQSDVFSLGVILYELVTGRSPFAAESYAATIAQLQRHEPPSLTRTQPGFPRDLAAICECAIAKEPQRRYSDAGQLANDLQRFLDHAPVLARSLSPVGRARRWIRRHPVHTALIVVVCLALTWALLQNRRLQALLQESKVLQQQIASSAAELSETNESYRETIYVQDMIAAFDCLKRRASDDVRSLLTRHVPSDGQNDLRGMEWHVLQSLIDSKPPQEFLGHEGEVYDIAVTPDGRRFFSVGEDRRRRFWDLESGELLRVSEPETVGRSHAIAISHDGKRFYTGGNFLMAHDVRDGSLLSADPITHHEFGIRSIALSPDEHLLGSLCLQHEIHLHSLNAEQPYECTDIAVPAQRCTRIDFSSDSQQLYFTKQLDRDSKNNRPPRQFVVWDIDSQQEVFSSPPDHSSGYFGPVDASADGKRVAIGGNYHVQIFDPRRNRFQTQIRVSQSLVMDLEISPDDTRIAIGSRDGTLQSVNLQTALATQSSSITSFRTRPHNEPINAVAWVDNERILTGDAGGRILLHTIDRSETRTMFEGSLACILDHTGKRLLNIDADGTGTLYGAATGELLQRVSGLPKTEPACVGFGPFEKTLAVSYDDVVQVWDLHDQRLRCKLKHLPTSLAGSDQVFAVSSISISPDALHIATTGTSDGYALVWDLQSGQLVREIMLPHQSHGGNVAYSPEGTHLLCAGERGAVVVDLGSGEETPLDVLRLKAAHWISPDEVLVNGDSGLMAIFNVVSGAAERVYSEQSHTSQHLAVSPDHQSLVTSHGRYVSFWHLPSQRLMGAIPLIVESLAFSPDGGALYLTTRNRTEDERELRVFTTGK